VMTFAVSGCFRDGVARVSWEVKVRRQGIATPRPGKLPRPRSGTKPAISSSKYRSPVMGVIAWIVLGRGAGLLANKLIGGRSRQRSRTWAHR
jgi:hypothetical protein